MTASHLPWSVVPITEAAMLPQIASASGSGAFAPSAPSWLPALTSAPLSSPTTARPFLNRWGVRVGDSVPVFTTNDSAYSSAFDLHDAGVHVGAIIDSRLVIGTEWIEG